MHVHPFRGFLYVCLFLFSAVEFGLDAARLHYTTHLPPTDPLNHGQPFYDPIVAEMIFASAITMLWSLFGAHTIFKRNEYRFGGTFAGESVCLFILFIFWLVGAAIATSIWGNLHFCWQFQACRLLTALVAFAWLGWITIFALFVLGIAYASANDGFRDPMHGYTDTRQSAYRDSRGTYPTQPEMSTARNGRRFTMPIPWGGTANTNRV